MSIYTDSVEKLIEKLVKLPGIGRLKNERSSFPLLVGFAAESHDHLAEGTRKLRDKNLDLMVVNDIMAEDAGFASDTNRVLLIGRTGDHEELPLLAKEAVADHIWDRLVKLFA